jgi:TonB-dependent receptor
VHLPGTAYFPAASLVSHSRSGAYDLLRGTETSGWGWAPLTDASFDSSHPAGDNPVGGTNDQTETTRAAYAVLRFGHDAGFLGPMDGNIGARLARTTTDAAGQSLTVGTLQGTPAGCDAQAAIDPTLNCALYKSAYAFTQAAVNGSIPGFANGHTYTDVLPSLNVRFHLTPDLQWRLAASKAIVRPTFAQMVSYTSLSFTFNNTYYPAAVTTSASGGNPNLKPTKANQYDMSLEWYFAPTGSLTGGVFYKDIKDYIFIGNHLESYTAGGQTLQFLTSRNANGSKGKIQGFELEYTQFYDMLPGALSGLGVQANFTYVDSSGGKNTAVNVLEPAQVTGAQDPSLPLEGLSKNSYNVALMYEKYDVSARLAYNWRERYLLTTSAANIQRPVWSEDYGQLDASVFYSLTGNVKVGVQATNVLNTRTFLDVGGTSLAPRYSWTDTDRRIALALRASF